VNLIVSSVLLLLFVLTACNIESGSADMLDSTNSNVSSNATSDSDTASSNTSSVGGNIVTIQNNSVPTMPNFGVGS